MGKYNSKICAVEEDKKANAVAVLTLYCQLLLNLLFDRKGKESENLKRKWKI